MAHFKYVIADLEIPQVIGYFQTYEYASARLAELQVYTSTFNNARILPIQSVRQEMKKWKHDQSSR